VDRRNIKGTKIYIWTLKVKNSALKHLVGPLFYLHEGAYTSVIQHNFHKNRTLWKYFYYRFYTRWKCKVSHCNLTGQFLDIKIKVRKGMQPENLLRKLYQ
jgi:hypothetical protein